MTDQPAPPANNDPAPTPPPSAPQPGGPALTFEVPANLDATYSNFAMISHSPSEMILDFARVTPSLKARVVARMVLTPLNAKLLLRALAENLDKYEAQYGEIVVPTHLADQLFKPPRPESGS